MRVLISGAAGFLGRAFSRYHVARGDEVFGIDNMSATNAYWVDGVVRREVDIVSWLDGMAAAVGDFDVAYHFAAPVGGREKIEGDPLFNAESLAIDSAFFRHAAKHGNFKSIVYPSSSAVYGVVRQGMDGTPLREAMFHPANLFWDAPDEMYGFSKMAGEVLAWKYAGYGHSVLCIRPFSGYGADQSLDYPVPAICQRAVNHEQPMTIWGSGDQKRDFIHVDDVVAATVARLTRGVSGYECMNIGTGIASSFQDVARIACVQMGYVPEFVYATSKPEGVTHRVADATYMESFYMPRINLQQGIQRTVLEMQESMK